MLTTTLKKPVIGMMSNKPAWACDSFWRCVSGLMLCCAHHCCRVRSGEKLSEKLAFRIGRILFTIGSSTMPNSALWPSFTVLATKNI